MGLMSVAPLRTCVPTHHYFCPSSSTARFWLPVSSMRLKADWTLSRAVHKAIICVGFSSRPVLLRVVCLGTRMKLLGPVDGLEINHFWWVGMWSFGTYKSILVIDVSLKDFLRFIFAFTSLDGWINRRVVWCITINKTSWFVVKLTIVSRSICWWDNR